MKKNYLIFLFFVASIGYSQSNGISYQAALLNPKTPQQTGQNSGYVPLIDKNVCLRFEIKNAANQLEYQEILRTKTDAFGMVNVIIGTGVQSGGTAPNFNSITWNIIPKKLVVALDTEGSCNAFIEISNQDFTGTPFAFLAQNAQNVSGIVGLGNGGTNATTAVTARVNLGLGNVDNTSDLSKPISNATQSAIDLKAPLASPTFTGTVSGISKTMVGLGNVDNTSDATKPISIATQAALDTKENLTNKSSDIIADANSTIKYPSVKIIKEYVDANVSSGVPDATPNTKGKIQLAGDLTGTATAPVIANNAITDAKVANGISPSKVGLGNVDNTTDLNKPISTATQAALDLKAPLASPTFTGTVAGITKAMVGLGNVDDTSDLNKPISTATQTALDLKQNTLTNPVTGTGTANALSKFTGTVTLGSSNISDNGTVVSITTDAKINSVSVGRGSGNFDSNTVLGLNSLVSNTTGVNNTAIGLQALRSTTTGANNVAVGRDALYSNTTGGSNIAIGKSALLKNTGSGNIALGFDSALENTTGFENIAIGTSALNKNSMGNFNIAMGAGGLYANTASNNTAIGWSALNLVNSGSDNIAIGFNAGRYTGSGTTPMTSVSNSIYIGSQSRGLNATGSTNEIVIGNNNVVGLGSNSTVLGSSATTKSAIYGNVLLGTTTDDGFKLNVNGTGRFTGQLTLGSTITNGTNTYTLPSATGTLALASDLHSPVTIGTANGLSLSGQALSLSVANSTASGALSNSDWTTFNDKLGGSGTTNYIPKFTASRALGNSLIFDDGSNVGIGTNLPQSPLHISSTATSHILRLESNSTDGTTLTLKNTSAGGSFWRLYSSGSANGEGAGNLLFNNSVGVPLVIRGNGNVVIGSPLDKGAKLQVNGAYTNASSNNEGTDTIIDFSLSNIAYTAATSNTITITNVKDGGTYHLATTATTVYDKVTFTVPAGFTLRDMGTTNRINGNMHLYRFVVAGTNVFVTMASGN